LARKLRKYRFGGVPRLTREQVRVQNALVQHLPETTFEHGFKDKLRAVVEPLVHVDVDLWLDEVSHVESGGLMRLLGGPFCVAVVGVAPKTERVLIQIDLPIAQQAIDRLLGGEAEDVDDQRPLSEIEEGVFAFVLLRVLRLMQDEAAGDLEVGLRLEGIVGDPDLLRSRVDVDAPAIVLSYKLFFDVAVGVCRVVLPRSLVERDLSSIAETEGPARTRRLRALQKRSPRVALMRSSLSVQIGTIALAAADLAGLERGDIVLIEGAEVRSDEGALSGRVQAHIGGGHYGLLNGSVAVGESGRYEVTIEEILPLAPPEADGALAGDEEYVEEENAMERSKPLGEARLRDAMRRTQSEKLAGPFTLLGTIDDDGEPAAEHSDDEQGEFEEEPEPLDESAHLLGDVTVAMVVELGRVDVSASDVLALRPGQVIELSRSPGDPVDLVVDGKRLGKGEVVEIEGELGVRILSLSK
jgi:type III secretion system YscQ/HrcQ family protein